MVMSQQMRNVLTIYFAAEEKCVTDQVHGSAHIGGGTPGAGRDCQTLVLVANIIWNQRQAAHNMNIWGQAAHNVDIFKIFLLKFFEGNIPANILLKQPSWLYFLKAILLLIFFESRDKLHATWNAFSALRPKIGHLFPQNRWQSLLIMIFFTMMATKI